MTPQEGQTLAVKRPGREVTLIGLEHPQSLRAELRVHRQAAWPGGLGLVAGVDRAHRRSARRDAVRGAHARPWLVLAAAGSRLMAALFALASREHAHLAFGTRTGNPRPVVLPPLPDRGAGQGRRLLRALRRCPGQRCEVAPGSLRPAMRWARAGPVAVRLRTHASAESWPLDVRLTSALIPRVALISARQGLRYKVSEPARPAPTVLVTPPRKHPISKGVRAIRYRERFAAAAADARPETPTRTSRRADTSDPPQGTPLSLDRGRPIVLHAPMRPTPSAAWRDGPRVVATGGDRPSARRPRLTPNRSGSPKSSPETWCKTAALISSVKRVGAHAAASSVTSCSFVLGGRVFSDRVS